MKRHWLLLLIVASVLAFAAGCAQQAVETEAPAAKPTEEPPAEAQLDTSQLPPPRPELDSAPDLYGGRYVINEDTLARMRQDAMPGEAMDQLSGLRGRVFENSSQFRQAVREALGDEYGQYVGTVMRDALVIDLADLPPPPQGEMSIAEAERRAEMRVPEFEKVYFDFDRSNIKPEFEAVLDRDAQQLMEHADTKVVIEGHADERGTNEYNLALGERRAQSVRRALIARGVDSSRLSTISYGEERPAALGHNEEAWAKNRRAVITLR